MDPIPRTFGPGTPEPDELIQGRHGDIILSNIKIFAFNGQDDYWEGPDGERLLKARGCKSLDRLHQKAHTHRS